MAKPNDLHAQLKSCEMTMCPYIEPEEVESLPVETYQVHIPDNDLKSFAYNLVVEAWGAHEWDAFYKIIDEESDWIYFGEHPGGSTASGACGFLNTTYADMGLQKTTDPYLQIQYCIQYAKNRYGTPTQGLAHHILENWW